MFQEKTPDDYIKIKWLDEYMSGHKGFIAGGCFRSIFTDSPVKDIDIFFETEEDMKQAEIYYRDNPEYEPYYTNDRVVAFRKIGKKMFIELVKGIYGNPEEVIRSFDFTITKFAYFKKQEIEINNDGFEEEHTVYKVLVHDNYFEHLFLKRTVIDDGMQYPISTFERILKYTRYGFYPCRETKQKILQAIHDLPEITDVWQSLYKGVD